MKTAVISILLLAIPGGYGFALQAPKASGQAQKLPGNRANSIRRPLAVRDAMLFYYVTQFQKQIELSSEVYAKVLPSIQDFVQNRLDISQRRQRAMNELRQGIAKGASEDDLKRAVQEVDAADADAQKNQQKFLDTIDPLLTARQQAKVRIFQVQADNQIRRYLDTVQRGSVNPNVGRRSQANPQN